MRLTFSSVFICLLLSGTASIGLLWFLLHKKKSYNYLNIIMAGIFLIAIRCLIPFEFFYTVTVASTKILPFIQDIGRYSLPVLCIPIWKLCLWIWCGVAVIKAVYFLYRQYQYEHLIAMLPNSKSMPLLRRLLKEKNIRKNIRLIEVPGNVIPFVIGLRKPKIIIPENVPEQDLQYILLHELEHYQSYDLYFIALIQLLCIIYWWNPMFYWLKNSLKKMIEFRVDNHVSIQFDEEQKVDYLQSILNVLKYSSSKKLYIPVRLNICNNSLGLHDRFDNVFDSKEKKNNYVILLMVTIVFFLSTCIVIEPCFREPELLKGTFTISKQSDVYVIHEIDGKYKMYVDGEYWVTIVEKEFAEEWPIYERNETE